jgi:hypothetical protein
MSLEELRDIVIVVYGILGILLLLVLIVVAIALWFAVRGLTRKVSQLLDDQVRPALDDARGTVANVRGTAQFISDTAVSPVIKVVAAARGVRKGVGVVSGIGRRRR